MVRTGGSPGTRQEVGTLVGCRDARSEASKWRREGLRATPVPVGSGGVARERECSDAAPQAQRLPAARPAAPRRPLLLNPRGEAAAAARRAGEGEGLGVRRGGRGGAGACSGAEPSPSPSRALTLSVRLLAPQEPGLAGAQAVAARGAPRAK